jgi:hypothetical protein
MAGDWIKMRCNLADDPRIVRMARTMKVSRATVVGACYFLWAIADQHTTDGVLDGYGIDDIDQATYLPGFAAALVSVGWLEDGGDRVTIVRFHEHNGDPAKERAQAKNRMERSRGKTPRYALGATTAQQDAEAGERSRYAPSVTEAQPEKRREEKRREEEKTTTSEVPETGGGGRAVPGWCTDPEFWNLIQRRGMTTNCSGMSIGHHLTALRTTFPTIAQRPYEEIAASLWAYVEANATVWNPSSLIKFAHHILESCKQNGTMPGEAPVQPWERQRIKAATAIQRLRA